MTTATITETFLCQSCLDRKPIEDKSADERYCQWCFAFLKDEETQYSSKQTWMPTTEPVMRRARKKRTINGKIANLQKKAHKTTTPRTRGFQPGKGHSSPE